MLSLITQCFLSHKWNSSHDKVYISFILSMQIINLLLRWVLVLQQWLYQDFTQTTGSSGNVVLTSFESLIRIRVNKGFFATNTTKPKNNMYNRLLKHFSSAPVLHWSGNYKSKWNQVPPNYFSSFISNTILVTQWK